MLGIMMGNEKKSKIQKTAFEEMFCYFFYVKYTLRHRKNIAASLYALKLAQKQPVKKTIIILLEANIIGSQ